MANSRAAARPRIAEARPRENNPSVDFPFRTGGADMKSHMDGEVRWVWILTTLAIVYIITSYANAAVL
jgi:hypothetical protein